MLKSQLKAYWKAWELEWTGSAAVKQYLLRKSEKAACALKWYAHWLVDTEGNKVIRAQ